MSASVPPGSRTHVTRWLYFVATVTFCLIVFGGFVRLSRAGLSIVEWNPVAGVLPPIGQDAWKVEFAKYQQSPEFRLVNFDMTMDGYRRIFYIEWAHRLIARLAGLAVVLPLAVFLWRGTVSRAQSGPFIGIALLFGVQGLLGWLMVRSGLLDTPAVSHYRLTIHLLMALLLLAVALWMGMNRDASLGPAVVRVGSTAASRLALVLLGVVVLQIAYGGLVAGLKAGHVSSTWPLMGGAWVPDGLFGSWRAVIGHAPTVHWIHRWLAFIVLGGTAWLLVAGRAAAVSAGARRAIHRVAGFVAVQVALGVAVIWLHVPAVLALSHQAVGLATFTALIVVNHRLLRQDATA